jgi:hypothetical protein
VNLAIKIAPEAHTFCNRPGILASAKQMLTAPGPSAELPRKLKTPLKLALDPGKRFPEPEMTYSSYRLAMPSISPFNYSCT